MSRIAATSDGRCVHRAFSTMRLALGYEKGLPASFSIECAPHTEHLFDWVGNFFPNHKAIICAPSDNVPEKYPDNVGYVGPTISFGDDDGQYNEDDFLWAFAYMKTEDAVNAHMVIGTPKTYDGIPVINIIIGIHL